ncbi:MAG: pyridoxal phosphate-dependent aminotransferase [Patescibacteria group bacterium]
MQKAELVALARSSGFEPIDLTVGHPPVETTVEMLAVGLGSSTLNKYAPSIGDAEMHEAIVHYYQRMHPDSPGVAELTPEHAAINMSTKPFIPQLIRSARAYARDVAKAPHARNVLIPVDSYETYSAAIDGLNRDAEQEVVTAVPYDVKKKGINHFGLMHTAENNCLVIINSPHNPTGDILSQRQALSHAEIMGSVHTIVAFDDSYGNLTWGHEPGYTTAGFAALQGVTNAVTMTSFSKDLSIAGLRCGIWTAPPALREFIKKDLMTNGQSPATLSRPVLKAALDGDLDEHRQMVRGVYRRNLEELCLLTSVMVERSGVQVLGNKMPAGGIYLLLSPQDGRRNASSVARAFAEHAGVIVKPINERQIRVAAVQDRRVHARLDEFLR